MGAASVGLLLTDQHRYLHYTAASNENARLLELFQLQNEEGPCLDAFRSGTAMINSDLERAGERWPLFAPRAREYGFGSVHAFPLRVREQMIGALNIFGTRRWPSTRARCGWSRRWPTSLPWRSFTSPRCLGTAA